MTSVAGLQTVVGLNVLVIPDKFKGTLPAAAAAAALARGWRQGRPDDLLDLLPLTDGGDGFGETFGQLLNASVRTARAVDAAHRPCRSRWWFAAKSQTAIIESANVVGLAMLPRRRFHPFELDTFGLGYAVRAAAAAGARRCLIGLGGSATNDGGFGLARALGWEFLDRAARPIASWTRLAELDHLRAPRRRRWFRELRVAVDVSNPLLGVRGATRVYGPQKGLRGADFALAERALRRLAQVVRLETGEDYARAAGSGAAGGLGFGLLAFAGGSLTPGFDLFSQQTDLERRLRRADLVVTGEGAMDRSTLMGKGVGRIAIRCRQLRIPCIGVAGTVAPQPRLRAAFAEIHALTELTTLDHARAQAGLWLERLAGRVARNFKSLT